jgi:hypothetical protein
MIKTPRPSACGIADRSLRRARNKYTKKSLLYLCFQRRLAATTEPGRKGKKAKENNERKLENQKPKRKQIVHMYGYLDTI